METERHCGEVGAPKKNIWKLHEGSISDLSSHTKEFKKEHL